MKKSKMKTCRVPLQRINLDEAVQPRATLDEAYIEELVSELNTGRMFPPVVVFYDRGDLWLADGYHRYLAYQEAGLREIMADVFEGDKEDAILHSVSANSTHGKRRTNADKRKAVLSLLTNKKWSAWTDRHIAGLCRVSQPFVSAIRKELTDNGYQFPNKRTATNGRKINVTKIGSTHSQKPRKAKATATRTLPIAGNEALPQWAVGTSSQVQCEIQTLEAKVAELMTALQEKEREIESLKTEIWALQNEDTYSKAVA